MKTNHKIIYEPPKTEVVELQFQGIVCTSGDVDVANYTETNQTW